MANYRVPTKLLKKGTAIEAREHPQFSERTQRTIARQHIQKYGPGYYVAEPMCEKIIKNVDKKMGAKPIRRRVAPRPFNPLTDNPFR